MKRTLNLLVDMRPALQGFAGIPQEARLLFRGLCAEVDFALEGLLQMHSASLEPGILPTQRTANVEWMTARNFHALAQVVISVSEDEATKDRTFPSGIQDWIGTCIQRLKLLYGSFRIELGRFETRHYENFVWRYLFSKTLPPSDFALVTSKNHRICAVSWDDMQEAGLNTLSARSTPKYPEINTDGYDIFIAQTPYPGRVSPGTALIIRYHDAIPVFFPHTIAGKRAHEAFHFFALMNNVEAGAWFACVSEASRQDLLLLFPEIAARTVTIHNMVSTQYFVEDTESEEVRKIIPLRRSQPTALHDEQSSNRKRLNSALKYAAEHPSLCGAPEAGSFRYLLVVSTFDPRKNHATCIAAWQLLKRTQDPDLKLVLVGSLGSDYGPVPEDLISELLRGDLFILDQVPANELRKLYRHASATVCPSFAEGFDFSGVESMRSGGIVVASDIPVHREIFGKAAEYFDPYSAESAMSILLKVLYENGCDRIQSELKMQGQATSARYLPESIMPQWNSFLESVARSKKP